MQLNFNILCMYNKSPDNFLNTTMSSNSTVVSTFKSCNLPISKIPVDTWENETRSSSIYRFSWANTGLDTYTVSVLVNFWSIFRHKNRTKFPKTYIVWYEPHSWPIPRLGIPLSNLKHYLHTIRIDWYRFVLMFQLETFNVSLLRHLVLFYGVLLETQKPTSK